MPLEELVPLGFRVFRPGEIEQDVFDGLVFGFGQMYILEVDENEEQFVNQMKNLATLHDKLEQAINFFSDNYNNWGAMTAVQKDGANRQAQRALANIARFLKKDLSTGGD